MEIAQFAVLGLLVACTVLNVGASVVLARMSLPMRLRKWRERADTHIDELTVTVDAITKKAKLWDATINGLIEEAENQFDRAERKRASAASAASRAAPAAAPDLSTMTRSERIAARRAQMARG